MSYEVVTIYNKKELPDTLVTELIEVKKHLQLLRKCYCKEFFTKDEEFDCTHECPFANVTCDPDLCHLAYLEEEISREVDDILTDDFYHDVEGYWKDIVNEQ